MSRPYCDREWFRDLTAHICQLPVGHEGPCVCHFCGRQR